MNADCDLSIILGRICFSLLDKALEIILYMHPIKEIGIYSCRLPVLSTLGIKVMKEALCNIPTGYYGFK